MTIDAGAAAAAANDATSPRARHLRRCHHSRRMYQLVATAAALLVTLARVPGVRGHAMTAEDEEEALPAYIECSSCDVPPASETPFCHEFVAYSACRTGSSWLAMDSAAEAAYTALLNSSTAMRKPASDCESALKRVHCAKLFNVCEMGSPQSLCMDSCSSLLHSNCSSSSIADEDVDAAATRVCGSPHGSHVPTGVANGGKCFDANYTGPRHTAWIIGFSIAVVFSFLASVGINLQKRALKQNELSAHEHDTEPRPAYRLPLWVLGFVLILAGSILDFVAFGLAPQSLLAPLAALTLVWNMMLAPCFNKEKLSKKDIAATLVIFAGATIAVVFASHTSPSYNLNMLLHLYEDVLTCIYFAVVVCCVALHYALIHFVEKLSLTSRRHRLIQVGQPLVWSKVRLIGYAGLAGTMGGQSVLFAKSTAELIKSEFAGDNNLAHFQTYLIVFALITCLLCQIHFLNCGLSHYDALSVVPIYQAYWIITGVLGGVIYFQEIRTFSVEQACMFVLGIMTTIFGVVLLSQRKPVAQLSMKRKSTLDRGSSISSSDSKMDGKRPPSGPLPPVIEVAPVSVLPPSAMASQDDAARLSVDSMPTIIENESELSTAEESDEDDRNNSDENGDGSDEVSRHVIDNYLDMSATMCFTEILDGLGFQSGQRRMFLSRRPSSRTMGDTDGERRPQRTVDDIEVGLPAATRENMPREKVPKRRSITFNTFQRKDDDESSKK